MSESDLDNGAPGGWNFLTPKKFDKAPPLSGPWNTPQCFWINFVDTYIGKHEILAFLFYF
jgi:hypothetical protein